MISVSSICVLFTLCIFSTCNSLPARSDPNFDYFVLSLQWPESTAIRYSDDHKIVIHKNVTTWSVHGLWPSYISGSGPFNCNTSWPFNMEVIDPILGDLLKYWPNLLTTAKKV